MTYPAIVSPNAAIFAERDQLREAMKGATIIANQAEARIRQLEADNVRLKSALNDFITDIETGRTEWETNGTVEYAKSIMGGRQRIRLPDLDHVQESG